MYNIKPGHPFGESTFSRGYKTSGRLVGSMTFWWAQSCFQIALAIDVLLSSWRGGSFYAIWGLFPGTCLSFFWNFWCKKKISQILDTRNRRKKHPRNGPKTTTFWLTSKRPPASKAGASKPRTPRVFRVLFFGVRQTTRAEKKKGGRYIDDLHPPNKLLFGWTQHRKHSTEANLPSVTTHSFNTFQQPFAGRQDGKDPSTISYRLWLPCRTLNSWLDQTWAPFRPKGRWKTAL